MLNNEYNLYIEDRSTNLASWKIQRAIRSTFCLVLVWFSGTADRMVQMLFPAAMLKNSNGYILEDL